jgi:hypothetical protein
MKFMSPLTIEFWTYTAAILLATYPLDAEKSSAGEASVTNKTVVSFPQEKAKFVIIIKPDDITGVNLTASASRSVTKIEITRMGAIERRVNTWSDLKTTEDWCVRDYLIVQSSIGNWLNIYPHGAIGSPPYPTRSADFDRLSASNYKGISHYEGQECYLYQLKDIAHIGLGSSDKGLVTKSYWISVQSLLPVAFEDGKHTYLYQFLPAQEESLQLPLKYQREWDQYRASNQGVPP